MFSRSLTVCSPQQFAIFNPHFIGEATEVQVIRAHPVLAPPPPLSPNPADFCWGLMGQKFVTQPSLEARQAGRQAQNRAHCCSVSKCYLQRKPESVLEAAKCVSCLLQFSLPLNLGQVHECSPSARCFALGSM